MIVVKGAVAAGAKDVFRIDLVQAAVVLIVLERVVVEGRTAAVALVVAKRTAGLKSKGVTLRRVGVGSRPHAL